MELRRTKNVKDLNRLLANMDSFEGSRAQEISSLIRQENLISLTKLVTKGGNKGFAVPYRIATDHPGSENFIYNAPRYYPVGEAILNQAMHLLEIHGNSKEVAQLKAQIDFVSQLTNFVFYSSKGEEGAIEGLKALTTLSPERDYLIGYVKLNEAGLIENALLIDDEAKYLALATPQIAVQPSEKSLPLLEIVKETKKNPIDSADYNHPLFLKLKAVMNARQQNLNPLTEELIDKLKKQGQQPQSNFLPAFQEKLLKFEQENNEQQKKIIQEMTLLNQKFSSLPFAEFLVYVKAAGMLPLLEEVQKLQGKHIISKGEFENYLVEIQEANQLQKLDQVVSELSNMLSLKNIPDYEMLILYQNAVSYHTLQKLSYFLLTPTENSEQVDNRDLILHILKTSWISDPDVVEFFLNEYDLSASRR